MRRICICRPLPVLAVILLALCFAAGCALRPTKSSVTPAPSSTPSAPPVFTVRFLVGDTVLSETTVTAGVAAEAPAYDGGELRFAGWCDEKGSAVDPEDAPVVSDATYTAVLYPRLLTDVPFLFPDAEGLLRPEAIWTRGDAARALYALLPEKSASQISPTDIDASDPRFAACAALLSAGLLEVFPGETAEEVLFKPDEPCRRDAFLSLLRGYFSDAELEAAFPAADAYAASPLTRAQAAAGLAQLLGKNTAIGDRYFPDVSPTREDYAALLTVAEAGSLQPDALDSQAQDGFLWFDGYLYAWDGETGYFRTDTTVDSLYFDKSGRYTSGSAELDAYVADTVAALTDDSMPRLDKLQIMHKHIRDDFQYLKRNYYENGETGWETDEALTFFFTGKGNCYNYAGAFCALARGLGYHAVCYSGTISKNYDVHGWTEILLDGVPYICDPEIQMQYWRDGHYYDTFMLPYEKAVGWQYECSGRAA